MTPHEPNYSIAHTVARLAGDEDLRAPRQIAIAWLKKHYPDLPDTVEAFNRGWETRRSRTLIFERYAAGCKEVEALIKRTPALGAGHVPPGGFNAYLFEWVSRTAEREPLAAFRCTEGDGDTGAGPAPSDALRAEDQPPLPPGLGP